MADPYRSPSSRAVTRGPRWGVTKWAKLVVRAMRRTEGWREQRRFDLTLHRMRRSLAAVAAVHKGTAESIARMVAQTTALISNLRSRDQ